MHIRSNIYLNAARGITYGSNGLKRAELRE
jgi:hypothetical protein